MKNQSSGVEYPDEKLPSWAAILLFRAKALCFQAQRTWQDILRGGIPRHIQRGNLDTAPIRAEWSSELWRDGTAPQERRLQLGKVQNLRVAARSLDGIEIPAGEIFSFWRQIGRTTRRRGYAIGRELRDGCLIPNVGGGLCQLSGALYNAALEAGLEIVERHAHSHRGVGTLAQLDRDATVFWNYVDLRFRAPMPWRLEVTLTRDHLVVRIRALERSTSAALSRSLLPNGAATVAQPNSCATCGIASCVRNEPPSIKSHGPDRVAALVDEWWPEWAAYFATQELGNALLCRPIDGYRFRKPNYQWEPRHFGSTISETLFTFRRAWAVRRLREQGAARQRALLTWDEMLARAYARHLTPEHSHLIVAQNLLPFLWRDGVLGGRTFDVLMSRLPMTELHRQLDRAAALHPSSATCADFRAPDPLVDAESKALGQASRWITPHRRIAEIAGDRALLLPWHQPSRRQVPPSEKRRVVFAASTLCRKGAYEMREAARLLELELVCMGGFLEGADFWSGVHLAAPSSVWWEDISAVVLPAFVEHKPRRLLDAAAAGVPVVASKACGLHGVTGVVEIPEDDAGALVAALQSLLERKAADCRR